MKYLYIMIAMIFMGCSDKAPIVEKVVETKAHVEVVEVQAPKLMEVREVIRVKESVSPMSANEILVPDAKVIKRIGSDIPSSCAMWSDGCNVCTRVGAGKASCDTGPECTNKMFSCLQWQ